MEVYYIELTRLDSENKFIIRADTIIEVENIRPGGARIYIEERGKDFIDINESYRYVKEKLALLVEIV